MGEGGSVPSRVRVGHIVPTGDNVVGTGPERDRRRRGVRPVESGSRSLVQHGHGRVHDRPRLLRGVVLSADGPQRNVDLRRQQEHDQRPIQADGPMIEAQPDGDRYDGHRESGEEVEDQSAEKGHP